MALQITRYNPITRVVKYRRKLSHTNDSKASDDAAEDDPDVTDTSYNPCSKVSAYSQEQKRLSDDEILQIAKEYSAGASTYELATKFGCHRSTISRVLKKSDIEVSHEASRREALTKRVLEMYADYMKPMDIGKELGINVVTVRKILHENNVHIRHSSEYPKQ